MRVVHVICGCFLAAASLGCGEVKAWVSRAWPVRLDATVATGLGPLYHGPDEHRAAIAVQLEVVASGFSEITDVQFPPSRSDLALVLEKAGRLTLVDLVGGSRQVLTKLTVPTGSEQGLLGWAFHPEFWTNGLAYAHYTAVRDGRTVGRIAEWSVVPADAGWEVSEHRVVLEVVQPYGNHNGGQIAFGPDGMLYIGFGDGGWADDPHGHGQDTSTLLGAMLRIDVDDVPDGRDYGVPPDNPLVGTEGSRPEIWAWGLRNPWRFSWDPAGRMVVGDVGQNAWEEIDLVAAGDNLGWNTREADHCFPPQATCGSEGFVAPVWEYPRSEGGSVTGGMVYTGSRIPELTGRYVFGDFSSGRLWALTLPEGPGLTDQVWTLGAWDLHPSTFARDANGEIYVADFKEGTVSMLVPTSPGPRAL